VKETGGCHAERKRSICFSDTWKKTDPSAPPQDDILTHSAA
jgi:hypothetical protein